MSKGRPSNEMNRVVSLLIWVLVVGRVILVVFPLWSVTSTEKIYSAAWSASSLERKPRSKKSLRGL